MSKNLIKRFIYYFFNLSIIFLKVNANEIFFNKNYAFKQYLARINWEKVEENNRKPFRWEIYKNKIPINLESDFQERKTTFIDIDKKIIIFSTLESSPFLLSKEKINLDFGVKNDKSDFYFINLGLSSVFSIDLSSELINSENNGSHPNKFKSTFLEKGSRNFRSGGTLQIFSQPSGENISKNIRLSYGEKLDGSRNGYFFSEIKNKYSISDWLSFNLNPKVSFTNFGNVYSVGSSLNWRVNSKFELIPETNINLNNAENNFSLTGRTYLSKNILIDTFVSNSIGVYDMAKQFKSESTKYGVIFKIRL